MNKLNNKGFAISTVLYGLLIIVFLIVTLLMSILSTSRKNNVELSKTIENELNEYAESRKEAPNAPELYGDMIPVIYNEESSKWQTISQTDENWYDYYNQRWANAVTIISSKRSLYKGKIGVDININDINTMWVWIPRYSYTLKENYGYQIEGASSPSLSTPGAFNIKWITNGVTDTGTGKYTTENPTNWYTPPAFTFGTTKLSGFWAAKFEVAPEEGSSCATTSNANNCNNSSVNIIIKPNVTNLRNINISNMFNVAAKINDSGNMYGISTSADSHMMKNSEWAAIAYLTQSSYGKYGNSTYTGANKEIYINNYNAHVTGCSKGSPSSGASGIGTSSSCGSTYDNTIDRKNGTGASGAGASTTGTIYGIYDMSGGSWEYVMGNYNNNVSSSGFSSMPNNKFYDLFRAVNSNTTKGQALHETNGWYNNGAWYSANSSSWILRSGNADAGSSAGIFYNTYSNGSESYNSGYATFRITLSAS